MTSALLSLTTTAEGVAAPLVISFTTGRAQADYAKYSVGKSHKLVVRFLDVGKVLPYKHGRLGENSADKSPTMSQIATTNFVLEKNMKQYHCGDLFVELWASDAEGFPLARGCYYSRNWQDAADPGQVSPSWREFVFVFERSAGLKHSCRTAKGAEISCEYQIVMYAKVQSALAANGNYVDIFTLCEGCQVDGSDVYFEVGKTQLQSLAPLGGSQPKAAPTDPGIKEFQVMSDFHTHVRRHCSCMSFLS